MKQRRKFTKEFKEDAVSLLLSSNKSTKEVAENLGIDANFLSRWKREKEEKSREAFTGNGVARDQELMALKKELADVKEERDILKKATAIFSKETR